VKSKTMCLSNLEPFINPSLVGPLPRLKFEVFVYEPLWSKAFIMRGGKVARGDFAGQIAWRDFVPSACLVKAANGPTTAV